MIDSFVMHALEDMVYVQHIPIFRSVYNFSRDSVGSDVEPSDLESIFGFIMQRFFEYGC